MKIPALSTTLSLLCAAWCIVGVLTHGWVLLVYPAAWLFVGLCFLAISKFCCASQQVQEESPQASTAPALPEGTPAVGLES